MSENLIVVGDRYIRGIRAALLILDHHGHSDAAAEIRRSFGRYRSAADGTGLDIVPSEHGDDS